MRVPPIESLGYWKAICLFQLWCALVGLMFAFGELGLAALFLAWNAVRIIFSPFLRFFLVHSAVFLGLSIFLLLTFAAIALAPTVDWKNFAAVSFALITGAAATIVLILQKPGIEKLIEQFEVTQAGT